MLDKLTLVAACLSIAWAVPTVQPLVQPRQDQQTQSYPDQGTLTSPPNVTQYSRPNPNYNASTLNAIKLAYTQIERMAIIRSLGSPDDYFKFDLTPQGSPTNAGNGLGGLAYLAEVANFPVLMGTGLSVAIGYLNPCGLDSIHIHPRATEMVTLVNGVSLKTGFVMEDGFDLPVTTTIGLYQTTIRPMGSEHWEFNDNCVPAVFVASLASEDPGVSRTAQNFFINEQEIVKADLAYPSFLDNVNVTSFRASLPAAFAQGEKECYARCGLTYDTNQAGGIAKRGRQNVVSKNVFQHR